VIPRRKSPSITVYVCNECLKSPKPRARKTFIEAILTGALGALEIRKP
jgi:hypothetical protein